MPKALKFSWELQPEWIARLFLAILPGVFTSVLSNQHFWLAASFLATCGILPYSVSHANRNLAILNVLIICLLAFMVKILLGYNWVYLLIYLVIVSLIAGIADNYDKSLRSISSWLLIGTVYGGIKLNEFQLNSFRFIIIILLTVLGIALASLIPAKKPIDFKWKYISRQSPEYVLNYKYVLPTISSILIWHFFHLNELEWIFWSSLSVVSPELDSAFTKLQQRLWGVVIGVGLGFTLGQALPTQNIVILYFCFIIIILSLRMFKDYFPGFILRCFVIVIYAGNHFNEIAFARLTNVILGGIVGIVMTIVIVKIYNYRLEVK